MSYGFDAEAHCESCGVFIGNFNPGFQKRHRDWHSRTSTTDPRCGNEGPTLQHATLTAGTFIARCSMRKGHGGKHWAHSNSDHSFTDLIVMWSGDVGA